MDDLLKNLYHLVFFSSLFRFVGYRQSEELKWENDMQIMEIEEALRRILHHLDGQMKVGKRRRCLASI